MVARSGWRITFPIRNSRNLPALSPDHLQQGGAVPPDPEKAPGRLQAGSQYRRSPAPARRLHGVLTKTPPGRTAPSVGEPPRRPSRPAPRPVRQVSPSRSRPIVGSARQGPQRQHHASLQKHAHHVVADRDIRIMTPDGSLIRRLTLDPKRIYQPLGT
jgi:hypothetical protein